MPSNLIIGDTRIPMSDSKNSTLSIRIYDKYVTLTEDRNKSLTVNGDKVVKVSKDNKDMYIADPRYNTSHWDKVIDYFSNISSMSIGRGSVGGTSYGFGEADNYGRILYDYSRVLTPYNIHIRTIRASSSTKSLMFGFRVPRNITSNGRYSLSKNDDLFGRYKIFARIGIKNDPFGSKFAYFDYLNDKKVTSDYTEWWIETRNDRGWYDFLRLLYEKGHRDDVEVEIMIQTIPVTTPSLKPGFVDFVVSDPNTPVENLIHSDIKGKTLGVITEPNGIPYSNLTIDFNAIYKRIEGGERVHISSFDKIVSNDVKMVYLFFNAPFKDILPTLIGLFDYCPNLISVTFSTPRSKYNTREVLELTSRLFLNNFNLVRIQIMGPDFEPHYDTPKDFLTSADIQITDVGIFRNPKFYTNINNVWGSGTKLRFDIHAKARSNFDNIDKSRIIGMSKNIMYRDDGRYGKILYLSDSSMGEGGDLKFSVRDNGINDAFQFNLNGDYTLISNSPSLHADTYASNKEYRAWYDRHH